MTDGKWIKFDLVYSGKEGAKTSIFNVVNKEYGSNLGQVKWYSPWRKYCFFPKADCVFESDCLSDIMKFLSSLMLQRKIEKQNTKQQQA